MTMDRNDVNRIALNGDLSMIGVTGQFPLLVQHLAAPVEIQNAGHEKSPSYEIDLTGIQALDACGCQLLAAFLRNLRKRGAEVFALKLSDEFREKIHSLGFDNELFARECA